MAQQIKAFDTIADILKLKLELTRQKERTDFHKLFFDLHLCTAAHIPSTD